MTQPIALSVLIPNFNYGRYIGETIQSVLVQASSDVEVIVTDNASTDNSIDVIRAFGDPRIKLHINPCNVGFAANLERVGNLGAGRRMLLLSSDDRMRDGTMAAYARLEAALGDRAERAIWGSSISIIDGAGNATGHVEPDAKLWSEATLDEELSRAVGYPVRTMAADKMLRRSLQLLRMPLAFATTCYPKALHDRVGGYSGGRLYNPDKWFLWKIMEIAETIHVIDHPLFEYRVHASGQAALQQASGALKHLTDQYIATFSLSDAMLAKAGLTRGEIEGAFIEQDIALRGLVALADGNRTTARRSVRFAQATYPTVARANAKLWMLRGLLMLGPAGTSLAKLTRGWATSRWQATEAASSPKKSSR